jgi:hypothetical protein
MICLRLNKKGETKMNKSSIYIICLGLLLPACGKDKQVEYIETSTSRSPAVEPRLNCKLYKVRGKTKLPSFGAEDLIGTVDTDRLDEANQSEWSVFSFLSPQFDSVATTEFGLVCKGVYEIAQAGEYTFTLSSDDGSQLRLNGVLVIDNDGLHGVTTKSFKTKLSLDSLKVEVRYFNNFGPKALQLSIRRTGSNLNEIMVF